MKEVMVKFQLLKFNELEGMARQKALDDERNFLSSAYSKEDFETEDMYFEEIENLWEDEEAVVESIESNDYWFDVKGELAPVTFELVNGKWVNVFSFDGRKYTF